MIMVLKKDPRINWKKEREIKCMHNHTTKKKTQKKNSSIGQPDPFPSYVTIA